MASYPFMINGNLIVKLLQRISEGREVFELYILDSNGYNCKIKIELYLPPQTCSPFLLCMVK